MNGHRIKKNVDRSLNLRASRIPKLKTNYFKLGELRSG